MEDFIVRIKSNISALNAQVALSINESKMAKNLEKLASGFRINRSGDDAAGLAISEQMRSAIARMDQAELNARDGVGLLRTGEGAMQEIHAMLIQLNGLAIQSANGVYTDEEHRELMQEEADRISEEIDRISKATRFNYVGLFQDEGPEDGAIIINATPGTKTAAATTSANLPGTQTSTKAAPRGCHLYEYGTGGGCKKRISDRGCRLWQREGQGGEDRRNPSASRCRRESRGGKSGIYNGGCRFRGRRCC